MNSLENQSMLKTIFKEPPRLRAVSLCLRSYLTKKVNLLDMLVRVTLVWRLWQWDATKKTQWESVQACLWFPYKFFFSEFRWKYVTIWTALAPNRSCQISLQAPPRPRNSVRCFLTAATLDCFERSKVTLCLSKAKWSPLSALQVSQNTGCIRVEKRRLQSLWAQAQSLWVILWPIFQEQIRIDNAEKLCFFFTNNPPNT